MLNNNFFVATRQPYLFTHENNTKYNISISLALMCVCNLELVNTFENKSRVWSQKATFNHIYFVVSLVFNLC